MKRFCVSVVLLILVFLLISCNPDIRTLGKTSLFTTIEKNQFSPKKWIVPSGETITVTFQIPDGARHDIAILKAQIPMGMDLHLENIFWSITLNSTQETAEFTAPAMPGEYIVTCLIPGHSDDGEIGKLIVVMPYDKTGQ